MPEPETCSLCVSSPRCAHWGFMSVKDGQAEGSFLVLTHEAFCVQILEDHGQVLLEMHCRESIGS